MAVVHEMAAVRAGLVFLVGRPQASPSVDSWGAFFMRRQKAPEKRHLFLKNLTISENDFENNNLGEMN